VSQDRELVQAAFPETVLVYGKVLVVDVTDSPDAEAYVTEKLCQTGFHAVVWSWADWHAE
jgi:hypothetical protein